MKKIMEVEIPDGFEVIEDQSERGYIGQSVITLKLKPITESAVKKEDDNKNRINKMIDND